MNCAAILQQWLIPWEPSWVVSIAGAVTAALYIRGHFRVRVELYQQLYFWLGVVVLYAVLHTGFDYYSEHEFFMHRIQHAVLHHTGPFLLALARPGPALIAGLPARMQFSLKQWMNTEPIRRTSAFINHPMIAVTMFIGIIVFWLVPPIHFIAMLDWRWYRVMNWSMAINGLMFWNLALNSFCFRPAPISPSARIAMMLAVVPPQIIIGALIFFASHELYPIYSLCGRAFDLNPMQDQQLGGLILWVPAAMMSVLGILTVMYRQWMRQGYVE